MVIRVLINTIVLMASLMAIGYFLRAKNILKDDGESALIYILVNITTPAMVINAMNIDFSVDQLKKGIILLVLALVFEVFLILLGILASAKTEDIEIKKMIKYSVLFLNGGFMGFPLAYQIFGSQGLFYATMFHIPNTIFMWSYGISLLLGKKKAENRLKSMLLNPGIIGVFIGLILYFSQLKLPLFATNLLDLLSNVTTFLSMVIIGSKISTIGIRDSFVDKKAYQVSFFRLIASPLIMIIIMKFLSLEEMMEQVFVMYAALPVAALMPILAQKYGGDPVFGSKLVVINHLVSLITIPFFFWLHGLI